MAKKVSKKASKAKATKPAAMTKAQAKHPEDHIDGCLCETAVPAEMYTHDKDLPPTTGGVAAR